MQSDRLTRQHSESHGVIGIFGDEAKDHDLEVWKIANRALGDLRKKYPQIQFRIRKSITKKEINQVLNRIDSELGKVLFVDSASIIPDGGLIEVLDDHDRWRVVLVSEAKHQGKDIENIKAGVLVGKNKDQDLMAAGNAIERAYKNISEIGNLMLAESYFPYVIFLEGSNFLTRDLVVKRSDGRKVKLYRNSGTLNRLDRLTSACYGMNINQNHCANKVIKLDRVNVMLHSTSLYTQGDGGKWREDHMLNVMMEIAETSLRMLASDLFKQLVRK